MLYVRSLEIETRLDTVLRLIRTGRYSTPKLSKRLCVSIPTVSRCVTALRERGYNIRAQKIAKEWRYVLFGKRDSAKTLAKDHDPTSLGGLNSEQRTTTASQVIHAN